MWPSCCLSHNWQLLTVTNPDQIFWVLVMWQWRWKSSHKQLPHACRDRWSWWWRQCLCKTDSYLGFICMGLYCTDVLNKSMEETITIMQHNEAGEQRPVTQYTSGADSAQAYSMGRCGTWELQCKCQTLMRTIYILGTRGHAIFYMARWE